MAKVWKDANEAIKMIHDIEDSKLRELDIEMRKKPKFDKYKNNEKFYLPNVTILGAPKEKVDKMRKKIQRIKQTK